MKSTEQLEADALKAQGYCVISRAHGICARIDRPDWREAMALRSHSWSAAEGAKWVEGLRMDAANHYRRVYSTDKVTVFPAVARLLPKSSDSTSPHEFIALPPEDVVVQPKRDAHALPPGNYNISQDGVVLNGPYRGHIIHLRKEFKRDPVIDAVREDLHRRSQLGIAKYGTTLEDNHVEMKAKLQHLYEELLDGANYCKWVMLELEKKQP